MVEIKDPCCWACKSPHGCAIPGCQHHRRARLLQKMEDNRRTPYKDPTGEAATRNVMRERNRNGR